MRARVRGVICDGEARLPICGALHNISLGGG
jgi:hypothetical protein